MVIIKGSNTIKISSDKKEKIRIFCDLDDVIFSWEESASKILNIDINDEKIRKRLKLERKIESFVDGGVDEMWKMLDKEGDKFWADLEMLPWARRLYDMLRKETELFCFLSSPSRDPSCASGKIKSLKNNFGDKFDDFLLGRNKYLCANKNSLLIDDREKNIELFRSHGGNGFLWPSPLKLIDGDILIDDVFDDLKRIIYLIKEKINE